MKTDIDTRIDFYCFDENEAIIRQEHKPSRYTPEEYVLIHESDIVSLHNHMEECLEAMYLFMEYIAYQNRGGEARGCYESLELIFKRFIRIGNLLDADLMREQHKRGPGKNIRAALRQ